MRHSAVEKFCLSLPATTLVVQWGESRVYKVGGKVFAIMSPATEKPLTIAFKVTEESFHILTEIDGIAQAPYLAKGSWVQVKGLDTLPAKDLQAYLKRSHALIAAGLSKKKQAELGLA